MQDNYRYRLHRDVAPMLVTRPVLFVGLNPGVDDDDAATGRMAGFTMRWGAQQFHGRQRIRAPR